MKLRVLACLTMFNGLASLAAFGSINDGAPGQCLDLLKQLSFPIP